MTGWTQPMCDPCWLSLRGTQRPYHMTTGEAEQCAWCGRATTSGIYVRVDPATVPYPSPDDD